MVEMQVVDYGIIVIISFSILMGLMRGFVREAMSLITWIVGITLGIKFCNELGESFSAISVPLIRVVLAFVLILLATLIIGGIASHFIGKLIKSTHFSITDRIMGVLFGTVRGAVIIAILLILVKVFAVANEYIQKNSILVSDFEPFSVWLEAKLPEDIKKLYSHLDVKEGNPLNKVLQPRKKEEKLTKIPEDSMDQELQKIEKVTEPFIQDLNKF